MPEIFNVKGAGGAAHQGSQTVEPQDKIDEWVRSASNAAATEREVGALTA